MEIDSSAGFKKENNAENNNRLKLCGYKILTNVPNASFLFIFK